MTAYIYFTRRRNKTPDNTSRKKPPNEPPNFLITILSLVSRVLFIYMDPPGVLFNFLRLLPPLLFAIGDGELWIVL